LMEAQYVCALSFKAIMRMIGAIGGARFQRFKVGYLRINPLGVFGR
jgi:hypothetical protein